MFQGRNWLKGALDSLADEQARFHRSTQPNQSAASSSPGKRSSGQNRSSGSQQHKKSDNSKDNIAVLASPDPDPTSFETENIAQDVEGTEEPNADNAGDNPPVQSEAGANESGNIPSVSDSEQAAKDSSTAFPGDQSPDVQSKLKKLGKLETKYQELLKAYRKAHARNAFIEPFEARLRECTPLTSISDPGAFVDYLNELNTKGGMVMDELKKVSGEKDDLNQKVEEAERRTKEALDEVAQLRAPAVKPSEVATTETVSETPATNDSADSASITSPKSLSSVKQLFSPKQKVTNPSESQSEELFSIDNEVPRLEEEIRNQGGRIGQLEADNRVLKNDLASAQESTEHMMLDLEKAQKELETVQTSHTQSDEQRRQQAETLEAAIANLEKKLKESQAEVESCKAEIRTRNEKIERLEADLEAMPSAQTDEIERIEATSQAEDQPADEEKAASKKKKKNKKKKKGGAVDATNTIPNEASRNTNTSSKGIFSDGNTPTITSQSQIDEYVEQLKKEMRAALEHLEAKIKSQDDLTDEIEHLRDELINVGQEHVEVKDKLREVQIEKDALKKRVGELEDELGNLKEGSTSTSEGNEQARQSLQTELDEARSKSSELEKERITLSTKVESLEKEVEKQKSESSTLSTASSAAHSGLSADFDDLKVKAKSLESDLSAAQQLAASRYKEMTSLRDLLQKAQPELVSLRTEVAELKISRNDLTTKTKELRKLELREESLRGEIESFKRDISSKEEDIRLLNQRVSAETSQRINMEESNRRVQRDLQRAQNERAEALSLKDATSRELSDAKAQLDESRTKLQQLERQVEQLNQETENLKDEISLKTAQHASVESLMASVRDQATEMATQMKEAKERCESLEDELTDAHRLMSERGREGETMRRLLSEVESRAETRVKEMREKMDMAVQERDRAEDEASSIGRRRAREVDDLKGKLRDMERDLRHATEDKDDMERIEKDLRNQKEDDSRRIEESAQEIADVRKAMGDLRDALDDGEKQARAFEVERTELKRSIEELQQRCEKLQKSNKTMTDELRSLRATRIRPAESPSHSSRSSFDSSRRVASPTLNTSTNANTIGGTIHASASQSSIARTASVASGSNAPAQPALDYVYLKNVLLQFLEQKDKSHQMQLVPVLSMLLRFDRKDEQKWTAAIGAR